MDDCSPRLIGTASPAEARALDFLADADVNRRVFGQPLTGTVPYYLSDYLCLTRATERFASDRVAPAGRPVPLDPSRD
jgi:hypothetical protein